MCPQPKNKIEMINVVNFVGDYMHTNDNPIVYKYEIKNKNHN